MVATPAAERHHFAGGEHGFDREHVIGGHAVFQAMCSTGIERDVPSYCADDLT